MNINLHPLVKVQCKTRLACSALICNPDMAQIHNISINTRDSTTLGTGRKFRFSLCIRKRKILSKVYKRDFKIPS